MPDLFGHEDSDTPKPGSYKAVKLGCTCPVLDNGHGHGRMVDGETQYWITEGCPLHGKGE